jgi:tetratricopeptide (TPR) repeat protein
MGDPASLPHGERALSLGRTLGQTELLARSLNTLAWAKADFAGDWTQAQAYSDEARTLYASLGNRAMEVDCLCILANVHLYLGRPQAAMNAAREAQSIAQGIENPWGQAHSAFQVAKCALETGDYGVALALTEQGATLAQAHKMPLLAVLCLGLQGAVQRMLGMFDMSVETHRTTAALASGMARGLQTMATVELVADHAAARDWQSAYREARALEQVTLDRNIPYNLLIASGLLVETMVRSGEIEAAAMFVRVFGKHVGGSRRSQVSYLCAFAVLERARGETVQAIGHLQEAAALAEDIGLPGELWQIEIALAESFQRRGDVSQAQSACERAAAIVQSLAEKIGDEGMRRAFLRTVQIPQIK